MWRIALIAALAWLWWSAARNETIEGHNDGLQMVTEKPAGSPMASGSYSRATGTVTFATTGTTYPTFATTTGTNLTVGTMPVCTVPSAGGQFMTCSASGATSIIGTFPIRQ